LLVTAIVGVALRFTVFQPPAVTVAVVTRGDLMAEVEGTGTVTADVLADIASKITGRVEQVLVNEGDTVEKGQIIAILDQTDLLRQIEKARAQLAAAEDAAEELQKESNRRQILLARSQLSTTVEQAQQYAKNYAVAQRAVEAASADLRLAEYNLSLTQIPALFSGIVTKRWVMPGASVVPGQKMFTVADTSLVYVATYVDQDFSGKLRKRQAATVILRGRENQPVPGQVLRIRPEADAATEETVAEVAYPVAVGEFQLGQWANVYIQVGEAKDALVLPRVALVRADNQTAVFIVGADEKLRRQPVTVAATSPRNPMIAVDGNLQPGDQVVLMPLGLSPGQAVRPRPMEKQPAAELRP
jgi:HlyD family secretion protein